MKTAVAHLHQAGRTFRVRDRTLPVLRNITLHIHPGDRIVLFGPSGCGKTTLLHILGLLDSPDTGEQFHQGTDVRSLSESGRSRIRAREIGLVFQRFHLLPFHSVEENIRLRYRYLGGEEEKTDARIAEVLERVGLRDRARHPAHLLSGGEQQRVCIARALAHHPSLFLADEPTGNLDAGHTATIRATFEEIADAAPVVMATHDPEWLSFASRVLRFHDGTLVEEEPR